LPNRILKESICSSQSIDQLKPQEEIVFYRLIVCCDDFGRLDARPKILKSKLFPLKDSVTHKNISDSLTMLASVGLVKLYEVEGEPFLFLPTWEKHQQMRAKKSKYPAPDINGYQMKSCDCNSPRNPIRIQSESESESESNSNSRIRECVSVWEQLAGSLAPAALSGEIIFRLKDGADPALIKEGIRLCVGKGNPSAYFARVMQNWTAEKISTYQQYCEKYSTPTPERSLLNPPRPDYSDPARYDDLESGSFGGEDENG